MLKIYRILKNYQEREDEISFEVYLLNGDREERLDWKCPIEVAQLAGLEIVKEEHNGVHKYYVRRKASQT
jgi:hypothetical protein